MRCKQKKISKMSTNNLHNQETGLLTFGEHLEVMRKMLFRIIVLILLLSIIIFCYKAETFSIILAPKSSDFATFQWISSLLETAGIQFQFENYNISLINTELSSQFMTHLSTSFTIGALLSSPFIVFELLKFISPALYDSERKYSVLVALIIYALFIVGILMSYYILFPISLRFLATYQVDPEVVNTITLDSYISTFISLTFLMGIVFEFPIIVFVLGKVGFIDREILKKYRAYALVAIMVISAIITPPDIFTLILVSIPLYGLYEVSIWALPKHNNYTEKNTESQNFIDP